MSPDTTPLIVAFVADLYFASRIESTGNALGFRSIFLEKGEDLFTDDFSKSHGIVAEQLAGVESIVVEHLSRLHPALILFDLNNSSIPWQEWIVLIKTSPATRRVPVVCFGAHMDTSAMKSAKASGADAVLARSRFVQTLDSIIHSYAKRTNYNAINDACQQKLSLLAVRGLDEFSRGEYFEAHEFLEEAWNEDSSPGRELYRAILQVAVAYYQIQRHNYRGAVKMFLRLRQWIDPLPDTCRGVDVAQLRSDAQHVQKELIALGEERIGEFNPSLFKPVVFRP